MQEALPCLHVGDGRSVSGDLAIARYVARLAAAAAKCAGVVGSAPSLLGGSDPVEASLVDQWLDLALTHEVPELAVTIDAHLAPM